MVLLIKSCYSSTHLSPIVPELYLVFYIFLANKRVCSISCGQSFTVALTDNGEVCFCCFYFTFSKLLLSVTLCLHYMLRMGIVPCQLHPDWYVPCNYYTARKIVAGKKIDKAVSVNRQARRRLKKSHESMVSFLTQ